MAILIGIGLIFIIGFIITAIETKPIDRERRIDYGCREDFSERFENDPWSMFRG